MNAVKSKLYSTLNELQQPDFHDILLTLENSSIDIFSSPDQASLHSGRLDIQPILQNQFIEQAQNFLRVNKKFHQFSTRVQRRAEDIVKEINKVEKYRQIKTSSGLQIDVKKLIQKTTQNEQTQRFLQTVASASIIPDQLLQALVVPHHNSLTKEKSSNDEELFGRATQFLKKQKSLIEELQGFEDSNLVASLRKSHSSLRDMALSKATKILKSGPILNSQAVLGYKQLLQETEEGRNLFIESVLQNQRQYLRSHFIPFLNNLNYTLKVTLDKYFSQILSEIIAKTRETHDLFQNIYRNPEQSGHMMNKLMSVFLPETYTKLERSFYKVTDLLLLVKIKNSFHRFQEEFARTVYSEPTTYLNSTILKLKVCIESLLKNESDKLVGNKYNIYSIASYVIISEHLKMMKAAYEIDRTHSHAEEWLQPFLNFSKSRTHNQTNKSLVIFNINIWELLRQIWSEQGSETLTSESKEAVSMLCSILERAKNIIEECCKIMVNMNIIDINNKLLSNLDIKQNNKKKVLETMLLLCSADLKKVAHAEVSLVIHEPMRHDIREKLDSYLCNYYEHFLEIVPAQSNQSLKNLCAQLGINIKALGRSADSVEIYSLDQFRLLLQSS